MHDCFARPRYGTIAVCVVTALTLLSGCENDSKPGSTTTSGSKQGGDLADSPSGGTPFKKISIDEILARPDLPEKAKQAFLLRKKRGQKTVLAPEAEAVIALALKVDPRLEKFRSRFGSGEVQLPSYSNFTPPKSFEYPKEAQQYLQTFKGKFEFYRIGIEHFREKEIRKLNASAKEDVEKFLNAVIDAMPYENQEGIWADIDLKGSQLLAKHKQLAHEPMFLTCYGIAAGTNKDSKKANQLLRQAIDDFAVQDPVTVLSTLKQ